MAKDIPHGTMSGYNYHRCRCDECRAAKSAWKRDYGKRRREAGVTCKHEGCDKIVAGADARCSAHKARVIRYGIDGGNTRTNDGTPRSYSRAHNLLAETRGPAAGHACADCGATAEDWSLKAEPSECIVATTGDRAGLAFSSNPDDYEPRCRLCHAAHDGYGGRHGAQRDDAGRFVSAEIRDQPDS